MNDIYCLPNYEKEYVKKFSCIFNAMSDSYKIFWFKGIMDIVKQGRHEATFDEIINHMITDAWYMVSEYHLNLGPSDTLEKLVKHLHEISKLKSSAKEKDILEFLSKSDDVQLMYNKNTLTKMVPYRLLSPFMPGIKDKDWSSTANIIKRINGDDSMIYHFGGGSGLSRTIIIQDKWQAYLGVNQAIISGWIDLNLINYLQRRNPSVPGISSKLQPPCERKMEKAKKFWKAVIEYEPIINIYSQENEVLGDKIISLDHFIPWSYVAHDELWNLVPTTRSINSSKSNRLANWDIYFPRLSNVEYAAYCAIWERDKIHDVFEDCKREHVNSNDALNGLYVLGLSELEYRNHLQEILLPAYTSAENMGFEEWTI